MPITTKMDFITSDLHLNHVNIISHAGRPFESVEHMNSILISNWNQKVTAEDKVYVVGDFFMGVKSEWPSLRAKLNGTICLVMGNHDTKGNKFTPKENKQWMRECGIEEVVDEVYYKDTKHNLVYWLNHFPPKGFCRHTDNRGYERPSASRNYDVLIFGHTHSKSVYDVPGGLHVGVDANYFTPLNFDELYQLWMNHPSPLK